jgi:UDP-2,4-diacetamido-2,4,6-trideoxy-beta-L-altropyranose hydrolase
VNKIFIITEANSKIGFGHLSRCLNIVKYLAKLKLDVHFVIGENTDSTFLNLTRKYNSISEIDFIKLLSERSELKKRVLIDVKNKNFSSLVLKNLDQQDQVFSLDYISEESENFAKIFLPPAAYSLERSLSGRYLIGWEWIPFSQITFENYKNKIHSDSDYVLLTFGGSDADSLSLQVTEFLCENFPQVKFKLVLGPFCTLDWCEKVKGGLGKFINLKILENLTDISEQILNADRIVGTYGQTYYEAKLFQKPYAAIFRHVSEVAELQNHECSKEDLFLSITSLRDREGRLESKYTARISEFILNAKSSVNLNLEMNGSERIAQYICEYEMN